MVSQKHAAASKSNTPSIRAQQDVSGGTPMTMPIRFLSKSAHTPNLKEFMGHLSSEVSGLESGLGFGGGMDGEGLTGGFDGVGGLGVGKHVRQPLTKEKKTRLRERRRATEEGRALEAMMDAPVNIGNTRHLLDALVQRRVMAATAARGLYGRSIDAAGRPNCNTPRPCTISISVGQGFPVKPPQRWKGFS